MSGLDWSPIQPLRTAPPISFKYTPPLLISIQCSAPALQLARTSLHCAKSVPRRFRRLEGEQHHFFSSRSGTLRNTRSNISRARSTDSSIALPVGITRTLICFSLPSRMPAIKQAPR
jgi:hypothetical protein